MSIQKYHKQYYLKHREERCFLSKDNPSKGPEVRKKITESDKGTRNPSWKREKIKVGCSFCKKILGRWEYPKRPNKSGLFFCNRNCKAKYEKKSRIGEKGPYYKHGRYSKLRICLTCGRGFYRKKGKTKYCSQKCRPKPGYFYRKGRRFEYQVINILKKMGFQTVFRSPRSRGIFDIFALKGHPYSREIVEARYVQVKASRSSFPLKSIIPKGEREKIIKNKMVIMVGNNTFYEIWIRRLNKKWDIYRLNWATKEFEHFNLGKSSLLPRLRS